MGKCTPNASSKMLTLKIKVILSAKMCLFRNSREFNSGHASYGKTIGQSGEQRRGLSFHREEEFGRSCDNYIEPIGGDWEFESMAFHWLGHCQGKEK